MELVNEYVRLFYFSSRKATLVIALTVTLFLPISALTWNKSPPNPFEGILGENVTLKWNFTLTSAETFDYFLLLENGDDVLKYNENKAIVTYRGDVVLERNGTPSFTLINLKWRNYGKKYCLKVGTRNKGQGKIYKNCTRLKILVRPAIMSISKNQTVNETNDVKLSCRATGTPPPNVTWSKAGNENNTLSSNSLFTMTNISREQDGLYWCTADNGLSKAVASTTITVQYKPRDTSLTSNVTRNTAIEGTPVTFTCNADSAPSPLYKLRFKGVISWGNSSDGVFTIQKVRASDQGIYDCVPRNILGIGPMATLNLTVLVPPLIDFVSRNTTANETDDVALFCIATGNPRPNITWIFLNGPKTSVIRIGENLTLSNVTRNQAGTYQCIATNNVLDTKTADVNVIINYKPEIKDGASREILSWINHETEVRCEAKGVPLPDIKWNHDGEVRSFTQYKSRVSTLKFTPKEQEDFGSYECTARNLLGSTKQIITIVMLVIPQAPVILRIEPGFDHLKIHWKASVTNPSAPVADYLVQVREKSEPEGWRNCTQISKSLLCTMNDLKSNTAYVVRVAGRNIVGYSKFTVKEAQTLATDEEGEPKDTGKTEKQQQALPRYTVDAIIGGVIGFTGLVVMIVAILSEKLKCRRGQPTIDEGETGPKVEANGHDNKAFAENPVKDLEAAEEQV